MLQLCFCYLQYSAKNTTIISILIEITNTTFSARVRSEPATQIIIL